MRLDRHASLLLTAAIAAGWAPALAGSDVIADLALLYPLAAGSDSFFVSVFVFGFGFALYVWTPLVVASATLLLFTPGLLLALAVNRARTLESWIVSAFALSLPATSIAAAVPQLLLQRPITGWSFVAAQAVMIIVSHSAMRAGFSSSSISTVTV